MTNTSNRQYVKHHHEDSITSLPLAVQAWFESRYSLFLDDCSYRNDSCPTFHIANVMDEDDREEMRPLVLAISGSEGEYGELYSIEMAAFDDPTDPENSGWGRDGNEDSIAYDSTLDSNGHPWDDGHTCDWAAMMHLVDSYLVEKLDAFQQFEHFMDSDLSEPDADTDGVAESQNLLDITRSFCR